MKILVIAGNYQQYKTYLLKNNLTPQDALYVNSEKKLMGYDFRKTKIVLTGEYWLSPAYVKDFHLKVRELQPNDGE